MALEILPLGLETPKPFGMFLELKNHFRKNYKKWKSISAQKPIS